MQIHYRKSVLIYIKSSVENAILKERQLGFKHKEKMKIKLNKIIIRELQFKKKVSRDLVELIYGAQVLSHTCNPNNPVSYSLLPHPSLGHLHQPTGKTVVLGGSTASPQQDSKLLQTYKMILLQTLEYLSVFGGGFLFPKYFIDTEMG